MIHLQVEEAEIGPKGQFNESSRRWVQLPGPEFSYKNQTLINGVDYHKLTYTARALDTDNVNAPLNTVITGKTFMLNIVYILYMYIKRLST